MNIGVVGAGWWGKNIVNSLADIDLVNKVHVFDSNVSALEKFKGRDKIRIIASIEELLNDDSIDAVCIATPPDTHFQLASMFLDHDKHIFIEKPPAKTSAQLKELGKLAEKRKKILMLDALYLFLEPVKKIKEIIDSGDLTKIGLVQMYRIGDELRREGAGISRIENVMFKNGVDVFEDLFFHDAGIILYLFDDIEIESFEKLYLYDKNICDTAKINFRKGELRIELIISWTLAGRKRGITVYDQNYIIEYDGLAQSNQVSKFYLREMKNDMFSFKSEAPLKINLEFFISSIMGKSENFLDFQFMYKIMKLWEKIKNG